MNQKVKIALDITLRNWNAMSISDSDEAEASADQFETSFYKFIDAVREWAYSELNPQPKSVGQFLELQMVNDILDMLPAPLHLNFETEAELIIDKIRRVDDEKYD